MRSTVFIAALTLIGTGVCIASASPPATSPSTQPSGVTATLNHGEVHYFFPSGWKLRAKGPDDLSAYYTSANGKSILTLIVVPLKQRLSDEMTKQIVPSLTSKILADAKKDGAEVILEPHEEHDDRFLVKLLDRTRKDGQTSDRIHLYRQEETALLSVVCRVAADSHDVAEPVHKVAEDLLLSATMHAANAPGSASTSRPSSPSKPGADATATTVLGKARLRILTPPAGWRVQKNDSATSGVVVSYQERGGENGLIVVSVRPIPREAKQDPKIRDLLIDEMLSGEQASMKIPGAKEKDKPHAISDARFLRKTTRTYDVQGAVYTVVSRQMVVGNSLVSGASLAPDERAAEIDALADAVATSAKPLGP
ncbi:hypothetical protein BH09PLA1_BH09PLA1_24180 [soil metagenome]